MTATPMQTSPLELDDFSGGKTDFYLGAPLNKFKTADNLLLLKYGVKGKLFTRPGSTLYDSTHYQIPAGAQRIGTLKYFQSQLFFQSARKFYYINAGWVTLQGPSGNDVFPAGIDTTAVMSLATWNGHMLVANDQFSRPQKIYKDDMGAWQVRTAGLPTPAAPTVTKSGGTGHSYLYRFVRAYTYKVGTLTYVDRGAAIEVALADSGPPETNNVAVTNIEVLANSTTYNYDTSSSNLVTEVYRTTDGGVNFFLVGHVNNGTTTYTDSTADLTLQDNQPLYTESGAPDNDAPPLCKVVHVMDGLAFYGHVKLGSEIHTNRGYQAVPGDIDAVPGTFFFEVQDDIVGISSVRSYPVVLCNSLIYRLDGFINGLGQGDITPVKISDTAGCVSSASIVQTIDGLFWAGNDGFYFSDAYQVVRISDGSNESYKALITTAERKRRIVGKFDPLRKRIWWTVQQASGATECDATWVLDLNWGISNDMPLTTCSGNSFAPTALEFINGALIRADKRGYTFQHADTTYVDPKIDTSVAPSSWNDECIIYDYVSMATNFGTIQARKWVPRVTVNCRNETNLSLQITSINDDGRKRGDLLPIRFRGNVTWGDPDVYWGDPNIIWDFQGLIDNKRHFPAGGLRCEYKQIELTNAMVAIISSDLLGTCTVNVSAHTATLDNAATFDWPTAAVDYVIAFATDGYTQEFTITARNSDTLTFSDTAGQAPTAAGVDWVIRGKPKGEIMNLLGYTLHYAVIGMTQQDFQTNATGEVGASSNG